MNCPVPGCGNTCLTSSHGYCENCGLVGEDIESAAIAVELWNNILEFPIEFLKRGNPGSVWAPLFRLHASMISRQATLGQTAIILRGKPDDVVNYDPDEIFTIQHIWGEWYSGIRAFRLGHPKIRFFRCWNCDRNFETERPPLLPPERYAHSTIDAKLMTGRPGWSDYTIHEQLDLRYKEVKSRWEDFQKASEPSFYWDRIIDHDTWKYKFQKRYHNEQEEQRKWREYGANTWEEYKNRVLESLSHDLREIAQEMSRHSARPDARRHHPCPHCGIPFAYILRPETETGYNDRTSSTYNKPLSAIEEYLEGPGIGCSPMKYNRSTVKQNLERELTYYYNDCGLRINHIFFQNWEYACMKQGQGKVAWKFDPAHQERLRNALQREGLDPVNGLNSRELDALKHGFFGDVGSLIANQFKIPPEKS